MEKRNKAQEQKDRQRHSLLVLTTSADWKVFADVYLQLREKWKSNLIQIHQGRTVEEIALERVRIAARIEGGDLLFTEIQRIIDGEKNA